MSSHPFLSPEWIAEARKIREEFAGRSTESMPAVRMNQIITEVPFGDGKIDAHIDTTDGQLMVELGHLENAEVKVTLPYAIAKKIFIDADAQAGMQAFMSGYIKVDGDLTKLMEIQQGGMAAIDPVAMEIAQRLKAITAD